MTSLNSFLPNPRFERKFIAAGCTVEHVLALVRRHASGFHEVFPPRLVHNVYLDTHSLNDYHDHVSGSPNRQKTRVRWYGATNGDPVKPALERKLKRGLISGKLTNRLRPASRDQALSREGLQALFAESNLPGSAAASLRFLEPSLYNHYHRHYFASMSGHVRLTVDSGLDFAPAHSVNDDRPKGRNWNCDPIIELKFEPNYAEEAAVVGNHLPFRLARCSKYVLGVERVFGL